MRSWRFGLFGVFFIMSFFAVVPFEAQQAAAQEEGGCVCTARVKFVRPEVRFSGDTLTFIPRIDLSIRTRGETVTGSLWSVSVGYEGEAIFTGSDAPPPVSFSGDNEVANGQCGSNRYTFHGLELSSVPLSGVTTTLIGDDEQLDGAVRMAVRLNGCTYEEEQRSFVFRLRESLKMRVGSWRSVR
jgi:hypothetical protein